ncbi:MAG TPA: S9 family peptidase [Terracidiphilus sp.]|jgi:dipeptidyl aminopeptidase/acylaminoacyl peptidase
MRRLFLVLAFVLPVTNFLAAQSKRPMTFEDMMQMKRLGDTAVSPDGKWLGYTVTNVDLAQNTKTAELWLQPIAGGAAQKLSTAQPGDSGIQFSPDNRRILFLSARAGNRQIWLADFDPTTGATTNPKKLTTIATEADNSQWSPDSNSIVFTSSVYPDCPAITPADFISGDQCNASRDKALADSKVKAQIFTHLLYRHWDHYTGDKRNHLFLVTIASGAVRDLNPGNPHDVPPFSLEGSGCGCGFSPDSKEIAYTDNPDPEQATSISAKIYTLDLTDPAAKPIAISTSAGGNFNPAYSPDGKYIAWRSEARAGYESDKFRLFVYDRGKKTAIDLVPKFDDWVNEIVWAPNSKMIYFTTDQTGESPVMVAAIDGHPAYVADKGEFSDLHPLQDGYTVIAGRMGIDQPGEVVAISIASDIPKNAKVRQLTHLNDALLSQLDLPAMESLWFTASDKTKVQGFLIRPPGFDPAKKYPVKFLIHGGPQGAWGDSWSYRWNDELFAANGYVVVMINPRGSTGYGQAFVDGVNGDWGGKPFTDLMTGLDYAERRYPFIDKSRECALGASYGGYMADWVLGHTDRFKCIVTHDGMFDAESAFGSTEEDWFNIWEFKGHPWDYYGKPDDQNPFRKWSPSLYAKNFKTPTLVIHSQLDYRLDVSEGFQLFDTLQLEGVPSKMLYFPDEGHWVLKPQNSQLWWRTVNDWVDEWTGKAATSH